ncbi:hypothetical protein [Leptospira terpstrae]|uniref:Membrane protein n=1 Tax=Leptospira terpstrae serovar Hualin str. LT 11-33 = ATCC 700639 TaxID=1257025 RepID=N1VYY8_9LEPT|nr:hypothetical protein [Leptospira terpstrae]EMY62260.1 putative membrane protein [Leptospira terpstrae serovar Hualin str. LT 11-33 = ATCC 700639]
MVYNGQGLDLTLLLWNSTVAIVAVFLACYLASFRQTILFMLVMAFMLLAGIQFVNKLQHDLIEIMGFIKLVLLLPLGLGAVLTFAILSEDKQKRYLLPMTRYINFAVIANIFVMVFAPDGDTYRGLLSRLVCIALLVWLLQEMAKVRFQTTQFERGFFIFRSSPLHWVYCHAAYRIALLSLPSFDSLQYLLLEPLSLFIMSVLYHVDKKKFPLHYYFGFADTIVVTTLTLLTRFPILSPLNLKGPYVISLSQNHLDLVFMPIQMIVIGFALRAIFKNHNQKTTLQISIN